MRPHQFAGAGSRRRQGGPQQSSSLRLKSRNAKRFRSLKKETEGEGRIYSPRTTMRGGVVLV